MWQSERPGKGCGGLEYALSLTSFAGSGATPKPTELKPSVLRQLRRNPSSAWRVWLQARQHTMKSTGSPTPTPRRSEFGSANRVALTRSRPGWSFACDKDTYILEMVHTYLTASYYRRLTHSWFSSPDQSSTSGAGR